jgi:hypothetical protein
VTLRKELEKNLRAAYARETGISKSAVRFPEKLIRVEGTLSDIRLSLTKEAVTANMQTNAAAFEAWSLILRVWCDAKSVALTWDRPEPPYSDKQYYNPHYERFLYRVAQFSTLFSDWFAYEDRAKDLDLARSLNADNLTLNVAGTRPQTAVGCERADGVKIKAEAALELMLCFSKEFAKFFGLDRSRVDRQLPVGLFEGAVAKSHRVFTGGKSAIDLVAMAGSSLWLFELKAGKNISAGALSELLFYTSLIRDVREGHIDFENGGANTMRVSPSDIRSCSAIEAVLLAEKIHPLVGHSKIVETLNNAADRAWNRGGKASIRFHAASVSGDNPTQFVRVAAEPLMTGKV